MDTLPSVQGIGCRSRGYPFDTGLGDFLRVGCSAFCDVVGVAWECLCAGLCSGD